MEGVRTEEDLSGLLGDFNTGREEVAKRTLNFIPLGLELPLTNLDSLCLTLGPYYGEDIYNTLEMYRENKLGVEGKAQQNLLLAIGQKATAHIPIQPARTYIQEEE